MSKKNERPATVILDMDIRDRCLTAFIIYADESAETLSVRVNADQPVEAAVHAILRNVHDLSIIYFDPAMSQSIRNAMPPTAIFRPVKVHGVMHLADTAKPELVLASDPGFNEEKYGPANLEHSWKKFEDRLSRIEKALAAPRIIVNSPTQLHEHLVSHLEDDNGACWIRTVDPVANESYMRSESTENVYREVDRARGGVADVIIPIDMTRDELVRKTAYLVAQLEALDAGR